MDTGSLASCRASVGLLPLAFTQRYQRTSDLKAVFVSISDVAKGLFHNIKPCPLYESLQENNFTGFWIKKVFHL